MQRQQKTPVWIVPCVHGGFREESLLETLPHVVLLHKTIRIRSICERLNMGLKRHIAVYINGFIILE